METIGRDLQEMQRIPLLPEHVAAIVAAGTRRHYPAGTMLVRPGDPADCFTYVESGEIEVVDPFGDERLVPSTIGPGQYMAEIAFLDGGSWTLPMRTAQDTTVVEVPRRAMLALMAAVPEMSDIIITVLAARRRKHLESSHATLAVLGAENDPAIAAIAAFAGRNRIPCSMHALGSEEAGAIAASCAVPDGQPAVVFGRDNAITDPTIAKVAQLLGLSRDLLDDEAFDVVVIGGGPSGVAAGVYAGAEGLSALVVEDLTIGGQAGTSSRIENYMGFPTGISGADLVWRGEVQAMKFGTRFALPHRVAQLDRLDDGQFCATFANGRRVRGRAVIVATGVQYRRLPIDRLEEFEGTGVYYAATETEARRVAGREVAVIGGGNSAGQAAMFLSRTAAHVHLLVRGASLANSMSHYLADRLEQDPAITIHYQTAVCALAGDAQLAQVTIAQGQDGERQLDVSGLFVMVGAAPNTGWLADLLQLDAGGFVLTGDAVGSPSRYGTSQAGIYAVGDVRAGSVKRVASAVGEGSVVISDVWHHLQAPAEPRHAGSLPAG
ncbi:FAD-dependent oxidoreductase [Croceibacterium sp. TMG7-5b_MA50]|uniref:FAD-dependent oxidoreductase n=1 Tax=Croceibacterium sp. TMG7-5b_MA50 TaxID=3121290 RepID=UPI0032213AD1